MESVEGRTRSDKFILRLPVNNVKRTSLFTPTFPPSHIYETLYQEHHLLDIQKGLQSVFCAHYPFPLP